jgi:hypothetical protein
MSTTTKTPNGTFFTKHESSVKGLYLQGSFNSGDGETISILGNSEVGSLTLTKPDAIRLAHDLLNFAVYYQNRGRGLESFNQIDLINYKQET